MLPCVRCPYLNLLIVRRAAESVDVKRPTPREGRTWGGRRDPATGSSCRPEALGKGGRGGQARPSNRQLLPARSVGEGATR